MKPVRTSSSRGWLRIELDAALKEISEWSEKLRQRTPVGRFDAARSDK